MQSYDVAESLQGLAELRVTRDTTEAEAMAAVRVLGSLDRCTLGVTSFSGLTPWERHPDGDELLYVVRGAVEVTVLTDERSVSIRVPAGSVFVVSRNLWHRQHAADSASLLFATGATDISWADDPRVAGG
jgi:mannose-6-phosphate isomerase-like protein (cupin superfamily)